MEEQRNGSKLPKREGTMSDSQFTIILGALRSMEEKLALRFLAIKDRIDKLELRIQEIEKSSLK